MNNKPVLISEEGATLLHKVVDKYVPFKSISIKECFSDLCKDTVSSHIIYPNINHWNTKYNTRYYSCKDGICTVINEFIPSKYKLYECNELKYVIDLPYLYFITKFNIIDGKFYIKDSKLTRNYKNLEGNNYYKYLETKIVMSKKPVSSIDQDVYMVMLPNFFIDCYLCWGQANMAKAKDLHNKLCPIKANYDLFKLIMASEGSGQNWVSAYHGTNRIIKDQQDFYKKWNSYMSDEKDTILFHYKEKLKDLL